MELSPFLVSAQQEDLARSAVESLVLTPVKGVSSEIGRKGNEASVAEIFNYNSANSRADAGLNAARKIGSELPQNPLDLPALAFGNTHLPFNSNSAIHVVS